MANSFEALKNNRKSNFEKLTGELNKLNEKQTPKNDRDDERFWKPEVDKAGNGFAVIRFLPAPAGEDVPFVRIWDHGFQGPGGWYIEKSLTTFGPGHADPMSEHNAQLWATGIESNKALVRKQKRRLSYYSNIYVVSDPNRPNNEGKVFIYKYGKKIFDKLNEAMHPEFADETPINPFDMWEGADFKLKIRKVEGYQNYDKSEFDKQAPMLKSDEDMEKVWSKAHSLQELLDRKHFKTYDELKSRLAKALGAYTPPAADHDEEEYVAPKAVAAKEAPSWEAPSQANTNPWDDEDDDDMSFFKNLAKKD
jgi:hypothetical protein